MRVVPFKCLCKEVQACAGTLLKISVACHVHLPLRLMRCSPQLLAAAELSFDRPRLCAATGQMKVWPAHHEPNLCPLISFCASSLTISFIESKCLVMHPYKGDLMMTQLVKVAVRHSSEDRDAAGSSDTMEHSVPLIRVLYSFHSSGSEIKQLLGLLSNLATHLTTPSTLRLTRPSDAVRPDFACVPEKSCNSPMPEWLQMRVAQCSLTFCDPVDGLVAAVVADASSGQHRPGSIASVPVASQTALALPLPQQQSVFRHYSSTSSIRWQQLIHSAPHATVASLAPACNVRDAHFPGSASSACAHIAATTDAAHCTSTSAAIPAAQAAPVPTAAAAASSSSSSAAAAAAEAAVHSPKSHKKRKKERAISGSGTFASPPKAYRGDREYQRYFTDSNDVSAWVRKTLLDR